MNPRDNQKRSKEIITIMIILFIVATFITLHAAIYMREINQDDYFKAMYHSLIDISQGNIAIFPITSLFFKYEFFTSIAILIIGVAWYSDFWFKKDMMEGKEKGTSDWNTNLDKYNKKYSDPYGSTKYDGDYNMILSEDIRLNMDTRKTRRNNNVLVVGGAGTGKSRFLCKPNILQANCSFVITDPAGELLASQGKFLKEHGYKVKVFNLVDMAHSNCYNPFHYIRDDLGVMMLINCLIKNTNNGQKGGDPFWEKSETALLQALMFYLIKYRPKEEQNFNSILSLLSMASVDENNANFESPLDKIFKQVEKDDPQGIAIKQYKIFKQGAGKTLKSILISTSVRLSVFNIKEVARLTQKDNIDLGKVGDEKTAIFIIIPAADDTYNFLASMMYSQLFETLYFHAENECGFKKRLPYHVRFILDEFANIGQIPNFEKKIATFRKYEMSCTIILQSLSQIKSLYKDDWQGIVGNCDTFLLLGSSEEETTKYVSDMLGTKTIRTKNISRNRRGGKVGSESNGRDGRKLMLPEEIQAMDNSNCIIRIRGLQPFLTKKYTLEKHPNFKFTADANDNNVYEIRKQPELLIKDNISLYDIRTAIKKAKMKKVIGRPKEAAEGHIEAFSEEVIKKAELQQQQILEDEFNDIEEASITEVNKKKPNKRVIGRPEGEFDSNVLTLTEETMEKSENEIETKEENKERKNRRNNNNGSNNESDSNNRRNNNNGNYTYKKKSYNKNYNNNKNRNNQRNMTKQEFKEPDIDMEDLAYLDNVDVPDDEMPNPYK